MSDSLTHPTRKILLIATTGGFTHASPVFEIGRVLAERGHTIEFATLEGQEHWIKDYEFVSKIHFLGPYATEEQLTAHYLRMRKWDISEGIGGAMDSKYLFDSFWPQTYHGLKAIMEDPARRPDMMVADFFVDAVKDMMLEYNIPIATVWPQMPFLMMPCTYIPGQPGFQLQGTLTSETASLWLRMRNELTVVKAIFQIIKWVRWTSAMRKREGVHYPPHRIQKPNYLIFVNSFFGLEIPRDLPPTAAVVGPLISDTYPPLGEYEGFLSRHKSVIYIALGTHVILSNEDAVKIINGILPLMEEKLIDGVLWAVSKSGRQDFELDTTFTVDNGRKSIRLGDLVEGRHPDWTFSNFAPQRAILEHESTKIYFTHGGGSSANEGLYHGKIMLVMGIFMDQIANMARLVGGGVAEPLNKFKFTSKELYTKGKKLAIDKDGLYQRNALRLKRIAHVAAHRKYHAADLVEELLYDNELRFQDGRELRPMHLQTADMRMPMYKAKNWDLYAVSLLGLAAVTGSTVVASKFLWTNRESLVELAQSSISFTRQWAQDIFRK
ncbi:UDP-glucoronosyl and UDP-glucosyl transferase [Talaromyces proteolyticus]|uniref:UDP-glucoronosyl and UDP-glucosyl transferase n=1 Tax=Talaromyces proteolyticus TaxID=1131652 RepID=A0AAD4KZP1_9EURO|nr:UDP-glucoronosyl and UDP-glucosyl transferase [Talaromyces proteolyticus]KAH8701066.1 UDP-glucoronosyl and UDP-glucosyl transferase [Talaromyces proteolyticus]